MLYSSPQLAKTNYSSLAVHFTTKSMWIIHAKYWDNAYFICNLRRFMFCNEKNYIKSLRKKIQGYNFKSKKVRLVIADGLTLRNYVKVSNKLTADELNDLVKMEVKKYFAQDFVRVFYDYYIHPEQDSEHYNLEIITIKAELIIQKINYLRYLGLQVIGVYLESNCVLKIVDLLHFGGDCANNYKSQAEFTKLAIFWIEISEKTLKFFVIQNARLIAVSEDSFHRLQACAHDVKEILAKIAHEVAKYPVNVFEKIYLSGSGVDLNYIIKELLDKKNIKVEIFHNWQLSTFENKAKVQIAPANKSLPNIFSRIACAKLKLSRLKPAALPLTEEFLHRQIPKAVMVLGLALIK